MCVLCVFAQICESFTHAVGLLLQDTRMPYSLYILASWDHSVNSEQGVANLRLGISNAIIDQLHDEAIKNRGTDLARTFEERLNVYGM